MQCDISHCIAVIDCTKELIIEPENKLNLSLG